MKNIKQTANMAKASPSREITTQSIPFEKRHCRHPHAPVSSTVPPSLSVSATHASGSFCWNDITHFVLVSCIGQTSIPDKKGPLLQHASFSCFHYLFTFYLAARSAHRHKKKNYTHTYCECQPTRTLWYLGTYISFPATWLASRLFSKSGFRVDENSLQNAISHPV
jgi:hypothetical protein